MKGETMESEQTYPSAWESLTLHNLCVSIETCRNRQKKDKLARGMELYWLYALEQFFYAV